MGAKRLSHGEKHSPVISIRFLSFSKILSYNSRRTHVLLLNNGAKWSGRKFSNKFIAERERDIIKRAIVRSDEEMQNKCLYVPIENKWKNDLLHRFDGSEH
jgi:hypothetical protein